MTTQKNVVVILAKKPKYGKIKTRIAKDTSNKFAINLANNSIKDLVNNLKNSNLYDLVVATDSIEDCNWFKKKYSLNSIHIQDDPTRSGLSFKMKYVFKKLLKEYNYQKTVLIPMDLPFIQSEEIVFAFNQLSKHDYVLGPETNGGMYLIGIKKNTLKKNLFSDVAWSTSKSFSTIKRNFGSNTYVLKLKDDINGFQDILNNRNIIKLFCPNLYKLLSQEGYYLSDSDKYIDFDFLNICIPTVSIIIEKEINNKTHILIQTRHKPSIDPIYSGTFEIPSGIVEKYETVLDAAKREVKEETGLDIKLISKNINVYRGSRDDIVINNIEPFCVTQQIKGGRSYLNLAYICCVNNKNVKLVENINETKNPHWVNLKQLDHLLNHQKSNLFLLNLPVLKKYLDYKNNMLNDRK